MPLSRYQLRDEYGLADPELYRAADKDDSETLLEGVSMAGLVGVLRQLGDLAQFAAEVFHDLHEEVMTTASRGHGLMVRVQQLEAEFPSMEKAFLSQTSHSKFFHNAGVDWHQSLHDNRNLIAHGDLPRFIMDSYEECRGPPRLFLLDKFDVAGAGACLKRYTDPSFFKMVTASSRTAKGDAQMEKKTRKTKKRGPRWRNGGTPEVIPTSHVKLHQLFMEEHFENGGTNPARLVKLKQRQLNEPRGKSYMEKFVQSPSPRDQVDREIYVTQSPLTSNNIEEAGLEFIDVQTISPSEDHMQRKIGTCFSSITQEPIEKSFTGETCIVGGGMPLSTSNHNHEFVVPYTKEVIVERESKYVDGTDKSRPHSDDIISETDNYMDALGSMEPEMETGTECGMNNYWHLLNNTKQRRSFDANGERHDSEAQFYDSQSVGTPNSSYGGNVPYGKRGSSFSCSDTLSSLAETAPSDGNEGANDLSPSEACASDIVDPFSNKLAANNIVLATCGDCTEVAEVLSNISEIGEISSASCLTSSETVLIPLNSGASLREVSWVGPGQDEVSNASTDSIGTRLSDVDRCRTDLSDVSSHTRVFFLSDDRHPSDESDRGNQHTLSHPLVDTDVGAQRSSKDHFANENFQKNHADNDSGENPINVDTCLSNSVISSVKELVLGTALPDEATCFSGTMLPETLIDAGKANDVALEGSDSIPVIENHEVYLPRAHILPQQKLSAESEEVPSVDFSGGKKTSSEGIYSKIDSEKIDGSTRGAHDTEKGGSPSRYSSDCPNIICSPSGGAMNKRESISEVEDAYNKSLGTHESVSVEKEVKQEEVTLENLDSVLGAQNCDLDLEPSSETNPVNLLEQATELPSDQPDAEHLHAGKTNSKLSSFQSMGTQDLSHDSDMISCQELLRGCVQDDSSLHSEGKHTIPTSSSDLGSNFLTFGTIPHPNLFNPEELPPLPPLPPMQWRMGKLQNTPLSSGRVTSGDCLPLVSQVASSEVKNENQFDFPASRGAIPLPQNPLSPPILDKKDYQPQYVNSFLPSDFHSPLSIQLPSSGSSRYIQHQPFASGTQLQSKFLPAPVAMPEKRPQYESSSSEGETIRSSNSLPLLTINEDTPSGNGIQPFSEHLVQPRIESRTCLKEQQPRNTTDNSEEKVTIPEGLARLHSVEDGQIQNGAPTSVEETGSSSRAPAALQLASEHVRANGNPPVKLPRPRNPLIDAVAAIDKSKLRKASERARPQIRPVEDRDTLLEQIRNKSFNLKPAVLTKPSIQGPETNLRFAAILEKANSIRQAFVGSDEDDDIDSWSDS